MAVVATVLVLGRDAPAPPAATGSLTRVDARTNKVVERTEVAGHPGNLAVTPGGIWMADFIDGVLWRYEPGAGRPQRVTSNGEPRDLAALDGKVYVAADGPFLSGVVARYDASTGVRQEAIERLACAVASGEGVLWVAGCPAVQRLSTRAGPLRELDERLPPVPLARDRREPARAVPRTCDRRRLAMGARRRDGPPDVAARRANGRVPEDDRARLPAHVGGGRGRVRYGSPTGSTTVSCRWTSRLVGCFPRCRSDAARAASPPGPARSGWRTRSTAPSRGSIPETRRVVATIRVGGLPRGVAVGDEAVWVTAYAL